MTSTNLENKTFYHKPETYHPQKIDIIKVKKVIGQFKGNVKGLLYDYWDDIVESVLDPKDFKEVKGHNLGGNYGIIWSHPRGVQKCFTLDAMAGKSFGWLEKYDGVDVVDELRGLDNVLRQLDYIPGMVLFVEAQFVNKVQQTMEKPRYEIRNYEGQQNLTIK